MKIYIVMIDDRHSDPDAFPFADADDAIEFAKHQAREFAREESDIEEGYVPDWLYYTKYSEEGDAVWVVEKDLAVAAVPSAVPAVEAPEADRG